ncbi:MAG: 16S rRNA (cytidine(1402)-2'-O)-methyltransferase [Flavobacteriaceae bacterium]|nr:16S rRNA (cytidine(1402)-2'-O)-methyltransferase [Bacteroidia bacterium]MBT8288814.1 16S rRNA (cytidine(1402)-2'-O)-methyltransferase [Bacteroidia bacterium]NNF76190.1 16S rRNA (cytidine(1402)-2'-O)-methyltransferase [Flavobacteriaceae bacterium]NNK72871.1 16S rRNA (cytidine(1402)-2'-O)-methyltransferase [Flavobacteriaceae bacterium]
MSKLYIVPTPIGNLKDMSGRAVEVLQSVDLILAEDTRTSGKLLKHFEIGTPMMSYHMHNEHKSLNKIIERLWSGQTLALISDAGTPGISDPGFLLTRACIENGLAVECLPGPTAIIPALVISGLPNDRFVFEGFLPVKKGRQTRLAFLRNETRTMVFYESPHKLIKTLTDFKDHFGAERRISVSRELSKLYEETKRGTIGDVLDYFQEGVIKGEFVIVLAGSSSK